MPQNWLATAAVGLDEGILAHVGVAVVGADRTGGVELRHACVSLLDVHAPMTVPEIVEAVHGLGIVIPGRASRTVSDSLRWEVRKRRAIRVSRGRYAAGPCRGRRSGGCAAR